MGNHMGITISVGSWSHMGAPGAFGLLVWGPGREVVKISSNPPPLEMYPKTFFCTGASFEMKMAEVRENAPPV